MSAAITNRPRLLWILLGALILVGVLPLLVSHWFLIGINRDSMETLEKKYLTRSAVSVATEISTMVSSYLAQLERIADGVALSSSRGRAGEAISQAAEAGLVGDYVAQDPKLLALRIVDAEGRGAEAVPDSLDPAIRQEMNRALQQALQGQTYVGGFQMIENLNQPAIVLAVGIERQGRSIGAVEALVSLRDFVDRLREESRGDVTAFVVDRNGRVLMHSEPAVNVQRPDFGQLKIVQEFMKSPSVRLTQTYEDPYGMERKRMLGTVAPVGSPDWGVVVQKEENQAFASVTKMMKGTLQWGGIALLLAILVATFFATRISKPIRALAARTREIAAGKYQQRVDIKSKNEIGELADNFNVMSAEIEKSIAGLKKAAEENHALFINSVRMLAAAIDAKDPYTRGHSERVAKYSVAIGKNLGLPADQMRNLRISALLHDVGKIGIDDRILRKPASLSDEEFEVMKTHPEKGAVIMGGVAQLIDIVPGMKYHHERWDGAGYPQGLKGEEIPMQARIIAIADTFDAMTTNRPYQKAMELDYVVGKIKSLETSRFDPTVVAAFERAVKNGDIQIDDQVRGAA